MKQKLKKQQKLDKFVIYGGSVKEEINRPKGSHRNVIKKEETTSIDHTSIEVLWDTERECYVCQYCGEKADACETECSNCYAWWSLEGSQDGSKEGVIQQRQREFHEKEDGYWRECRECGRKFLPRFIKQKCCDECRGKHDTMPILHPAIDEVLEPEKYDRGDITKEDTVWECKDCGKMFYGGL